MMKVGLVLLVLLMVPFVYGGCEGYYYAQYEREPRLFWFYFYEMRGESVPYADFVAENPQTILLGQKVCMPKAVSDTYSLAEGDTVLNIWQHYGALRGYTLRETALEVMKKQDAAVAEVYAADLGRLDPYTYSEDTQMTFGSLSFGGKTNEPVKNKQIRDAIDKFILPSTYVDNLTLNDLQGSPRPYTLSDDLNEILARFAYHQANDGIVFRAVVLEPSFLEGSSISYNALAMAAYNKKFESQDNRQVLILYEKGRALTLAYDADKFNEEAMDMAVVKTLGLIELGDSLVNVIKDIAQGIVDAS